MIVAHTDCGVQHTNSSSIKQKMTNRGVSTNTINTMEYCGVNFDNWLSGFSDVEDSLTGELNKIV